MTTNLEQTEMGETNQLITSSEASEQAEPMDQGSPRPQASPNLSLITRLFATHSSGSNESCGTYITCKMSQLEEAAAKEFAEVTEFAQRESISEPLSITPSIPQYDHNRLSETSHPVVVFLDSPKQVINDPELEYPESAEKRPQTDSLTGSSTNGTALGDLLQVGTTKKRQTVPGASGEHVNIQPPITKFSDSDFRLISVWTLCWLYLDGNIASRCTKVTSRNQ